MSNNYQEQYDNLMCFAKKQNRKKLKKVNSNYTYYESHHIIPKCINGPDTIENKILLTPEEHFEAHQLLALIYPHNTGLLSTAVRMSGRFKITKEEYGIIKRNFSNKCSEKMAGKNNPRYGKTPWNKNRKASEETKSKLREAHKNPNRKNTLSELLKTEKFKQTLRGPKKKQKCPYCNFVGGGNSMKRWHFDNCKK